MDVSFCTWLSTVRSHPSILLWFNWGGGQGQDEMAMQLEVPSTGPSQIRVTQGGQGRLASLLIESTKVS